MLGIRLFSSAKETLDFCHSFTDNKDNLKNGVEI